MVRTKPANPVLIFVSRYNTARRVTIPLSRRVDRDTLTHAMECMAALEDAETAIALEADDTDHLLPPLSPLAPPEYDALCDDMLTDPPPDLEDEHTVGAQWDL